MVGIPSGAGISTCPRGVEGVICRTLMSGSPSAGRDGVVLQLKLLKRNRQHLPPSSFRRHASWLRGNLRRPDDRIRRVSFPLSCHWLGELVTAMRGVPLVRSNAALIGGHIVLPETEHSAVNVKHHWCFGRYHSVGWCEPRDIASPITEKSCKGTYFPVRFLSFSSTKYTVLHMLTGRDSYDKISRTKASQGQDASGPLVILQWRS